MSLFLKAAAKCDEEGCSFEAEMYIFLDLSAGQSLLMINDLPAPPEWEAFSRLGKKFFRCPECIAKRKRNRLKVVSDERPEEG